ncbi:hypothetical protein [Maridesulfovibrio sp.]|uniref:hypothetical protein n=1 Tax=Maridesulfovibrio sp. TaxID=2795000 RepID=UPI002A186A9C|nr:hypothetical protein [Maridesulfovibrio sp.]
MKEHSRDKPLTNCNLSAIGQNIRDGDRIEKKKGVAGDNKLSILRDQVMVRPVSIRKKTQHPPPEIHRKVLNRPPVICDRDMLSIVEVLRKTGNLFEKSPGVFNLHSAEELRNIVTSNLNVNFAGKGSEELFHNRGKSRFYLETEGKDVFVGKCAVWKCPEGIGYMVDSMLRSASCPECKAVLIVFNKTESCFRSVVVQTRKALMLHPNLKSMDEAPDECEWRMTMHRPDDNERRISFHAMVYNLYKTAPRPCPCLSELEREFFSLGS